MRLAEHLAIVLSDLAQSDCRVYVLDGDLADSDGAERFAERHPSRFVMGGIAEQNLVTFAAGMASCGLRPFVFSFSAFLIYRAYDQIRIGLSQARQPVVLVGSHAGGLTSRNGRTHAALNDFVVIDSLPGIQVWQPADFDDIEICLHAILESDEPGYIRLSRSDFDKNIRLPGLPGANRWVFPCSEFNVVSTGLATHWAIDVVERARALGLNVGLLHLNRVEIESKNLLLLSGSRRVAVLEDHYGNWGVGVKVNSLLAKVKVMTIGWPERFLGDQGDEETVRCEHSIDSESLVNRLVRFFRSSNIE